MKTAGMVLDFYDDATGDLLKRSFPTAEVLPDIVKTAHILSNEERDILRDDAYALILLNEGKTLRKFACVDAGNTLLSALYFMENKDSLPEEAQKVASANILAAAEEFGLPLRDLEKIAAGPPKGSTKGAARTRDPMRQPIVGDEADWAQRTNISSVSGGSDSGRVIPTASQMKTAGLAEVGTAAKGLARAAGRQIGENLPTIAATAGLSTVGARHVARQERHKTEKKLGLKKGEQVDFLDSHHKLNPGSKPMGKVANMVDVSALSAPVLVKKASANLLALDRYPLDSYADVAAAVRYFSENHLEMTPQDRHEYAVKTAARAEELGIQSTDILDRYGSTEYAPDVEAHLASRRAIAPDHKDLWNTLQEKRASIEPEKFAELLGEADVEAGLNWYYGGDVSDPFFATFGGNRVKEASAAWNWQSRTGDYVSADQLCKLARNGRPLVKKQFDSALADAFCRDPIVIFESLPDLQKTLLARLASQEFDGLPTN